jgi:hypothetical protein
MYKITRKIALILDYMVTNSWKISSRVLSLGLTETAEFLDYSLETASGTCSSKSHQDKIVTTVCCFGRVFIKSDNLYGTWFVFITECDFGNTDLKGSSFMEWRHVSGVHTLWSVQWCLNSLYSRTWNFVHKTAQTAAIICCYEELKISKLGHLFICHKQRPDRRLQSILRFCICKISNHVRT